MARPPARHAYGDALEPLKADQLRTDLRRSSAAPRHLCGDGSVKTARGSLDPIRTEASRRADAELQSFARSPASRRERVRALPGADALKYGVAPLRGAAYRDGDRICEGLRGSPRIIGADLLRQSQRMHPPFKLVADVVLAPPRHP